MQPFALPRQSDVSMSCAGFSVGTISAKHQHCFGGKGGRRNNFLSRWAFFPQTPVPQKTQKKNKTNPLSARMVRNPAAPEGNQANRFVALLPQRLLKETVVPDVVFHILTSKYQPNTRRTRMIHGIGLRAISMQGRAPQQEVAVAVFTGNKCSVNCLRLPQKL